MDFATPIGIVVALIAILVSMVLDRGNPASLIAPPAILLVLGGTIGVSLAGVRLKDLGNLVGALKSAILAKVSSPDQSIADMVRFADIARKEGVLALENAVRSVDDPFLKKAVQLAVDGVESERIRDLLEAEIEAMEARHKASARFFKSMGGYAPTIGILGTVIGLIHVLANLSSPNTLGPAISSAFSATLWGVMSANVFWLPIETKLTRISELEVQTRSIIISGVLAIQSGSSPRALEEQLLSYLAPRERAASQTTRTKKQAA
ncbi:MAG: flagellar motor protein [Actinomycetota bacterium]|nr:flagellar motor protein [Actinomycetota bacterium]